MSDDAFTSIWLGLILAASAGWLAYRVVAARRRGDDAAAARVRSLNGVAPVVVAGIVGLMLFLVLISIGARIALFTALGGDDDMRGLLYGLIALAVLSLLGLPIGTLAFVIRRRRRSA